MANRPVSVRILHPEPGPAAGPIERWVGGSRATLADRHRMAFLAAGAADAIVLSGPPDDTPFGARLRAIVRADRPAGLVVMGSGAIPLATGRDYRDLVTAARADGRTALTNNRYSADVVAVACAEALADLPDLPGDNALPRWLAEVAGFAVTDLRNRWRLAVDVDGPLELVLLGGGSSAPPGVVIGRLRAALTGVRAVAGDRRAELVVAGRASVATLSWLEHGIPARVRAIVEERGLRAATRLAQGPASGVERAAARTAGAVTAGPERPPASLLGELLERDGPGAIGAVLGRLGDAAVIDSRVLLAHRLGADDSAWPPPEDRFASDLLLPDAIADPWLRELTAAAAGAAIPVVLGGHSLVGPGLRLLLGRQRRRGLPWT